MTEQEMDELLEVYESRVRRAEAQTKRYEKWVTRLIWGWGISLFIVACEAILIGRACQ